MRAGECPDLQASMFTVGNKFYYGYKSNTQRLTIIIIYKSTNKQREYNTA